MIMELTGDEIVILSQLVDQAIREIGPEIHHTASRSVRTDLQHRRERLGAMQERLNSLLPEHAKA